MGLLTTILGWTAAIIHIFGFINYHRSMLKGASVLYTATWALWAFLSIVNCATYLTMTHSDYAKGAVTISSAIACITLLVLAHVRGRTTELDIKDKIALGIGLLSLTVWIVFRDAVYANLVLQFAFIVSFYPTYKGVWQKPRTENAFPWFIWTSAYVVNIAVILISWDNRFMDLVYPTLCLLLHGGVGVIVLSRRQD